MTYRILMLLGIGLLFLRCSEERPTIINDNDHVPPPVSNVVVESIPGGAAITYDLPKGGKSLYVLAEWEQNGKVMTAQASFYDNSLVVEGFGDTQEYEVNLYTVGRNLKRSEPVLVKIKPLTPPILSVLESFDIHEDFGGLRMDFFNTSEEEVSIEVYTMDDLGDWVPVETFYTGRPEGRLFVRGFGAEERQFGFIVKDQWGNQTEMLTKTVTPLFERKFDTELFRTLSPSLPGDMEAYEGTTLSNIWSGNYTANNSIPTDGFFRSANGLTLPAHFTFDLGVVGKLGRYVLRQRGAYISPYTFTYSGGSPARGKYGEGPTNPHPEAGRAGLSSWTAKC
ncbi:DUF4959 domain-containing protein [Anseongella ginsenosidimutans]|uniref:DUF4959 domain-containing protein n=1 Tax=Anseongella ginsenosidimutans TaxID=496056 RepID=UPI0011CC88C6|nr:DUF4959 domain-containing protein [Anseongella ginsenosidimutans]QEC52377.1 DUF5126 domain-containing protein [Anseongella ginsenosidimutans]